MPENTEPGRQQKKSQRARETLCDAAITCLVKGGYNETSLNRVASVAGLSKGALQYHFPTKEDLMVATADRLLERPLHTPVTGKDAPQSVAESLLLTWKRFVNTDAYRALLEILVAARTDAMLHDRITPNLQKWNTAFDQQAVNTYASTIGRADDVQILLTITRGLWQGLILHDRLASDPEENIRCVNRWIELVTPLLELKNE